MPQVPFEVRELESDGTFTQPPGAGVDNQSPFLQASDIVNDYIATQPTPVPSITTGYTVAITAFDAYVRGQRVVYPGGNFTVEASTTSYLDLSNIGTMTVSTSGTVTSNSLRVWELTASAAGITSITLLASAYPTINTLSVANLIATSMTGGAMPVLQETAATTISADTAVAIVNGQLVPAQSGLVAQAGYVVGIAINGGPTGTTINIQQLGSLTLSSWNWTLGQPIFVGPNGPLTQTVPTSGFSQIVGIPVSSTSFTIGLQPPILIV
jgi:hypothetical protein